MFAPLAHAASGPDAAKPSNARPAIRPLRLIVGFMGGRVHADNLLHKEATIAQDLREPAADNLHVLVFANHNGGSALRSVLHLIDQDGDGRISEAERRAVNIAIYGHSWGASETIALARQLQTQNIPVALTVQVDSVQKPGENDAEIPSNVHEAVNLYQRDGLLRGREAIHAQDPAHTRILANEQYHYNAQHAVDIARFPWFARTFMRQHIMIENDPAVWTRVEAYLRNAMDPRSPGLDSAHVALAEQPAIPR
ncbi:hypothetical protein [Terriglobus aquaticus]|uniref:EF-hand domain-containing protein n=1 Tax=Terriglobus aquaticus TaxID=940139 RepID=A0ABW9KFB0_9BACT|nr:hypothetical protein [Terriglobus aquaticus]